MTDDLPDDLPNVITAQTGRIHASAFADDYFSHVDGYAETQYVFLGGNQLPARWASPAQPPFTIAELGFGTGLNCLAAWQLWQHVQPQHTLHYIGFELHPLQRQQVATTLAQWPVLTPLVQALWAADLPQKAGVHVLHRPQLQLTLVIGDAQHTVPQYVQQHPATVDAWFLDGFAPSRNPEMWDAHLLAAVYAGTAAEGTAATFTAAGFVRRNLASAGFTVEKTKGFAQKREMIQARKPASLALKS